MFFVILSNKCFIDLDFLLLVCGFFFEFECLIRLYVNIIMKVKGVKEIFWNKYIENIGELLVVIFYRCKYLYFYRIGVNIYF